MRSPDAWLIFAEFCEVVVRRKEEDERARERGLGPPGGPLMLSPLNSSQRAQFRRGIVAARRHRCINVRDRVYIRVYNCVFVFVYGCVR